MRKGGFILAGALALLISCSFGAQVAWADEAATIYDPGTVFFVDLTLSPTAEAELEAEPGEYVDGTVEITASDGTPSGEAGTPLVPQQPAEIHLKGSVGGSFRELDEKPGFKLKFKKSEPVLGLHKMTLNNMVQDPSMVHETLAYTTFRENGLPASRTGFAYVRLNGNDIGVYLDLENLDDIALAKIFGSFDKDAGQHLYEGEQGDDVTPGGAGGFEVDEGNDEAGEQEDLEALIDAVNGEGSSSWSQRVEPYVDFDQMTRFWAVEKYIDHWDGYSGHAGQEQVEHGERPNNYYLYSEPSGRFQMLPWGTDQAWVFTEGVPSREVTFDGPGGVLFNKCLEDEACFRLYWEALGDVTQAVATSGPGAFAEDTAELLEPWQIEERTHGRPDPDSNEASKVEAAQSETLAFIAGRQEEAEDWLAANEPPEEAGGEESEEGPHDEPSPGSPSSPEGGRGSTSPAAAGSSTAPPSTEAPSLAIGAVSGHAVTVRVDFPEAGRAVATGRVRLGKHTVQACRVARTASGPQELKLTCHLSKRIRHYLHRHALRLTLRIRITLASGQTKVITRQMPLHRIHKHK